MKLFNIFIKKNSENKIEDIVFLREGFSYAAFIFSNLWFFYHKMWKEFFGVFLINVILIAFNNFYSEIDKILLEIGLLLIIGLNATYWRAISLQKKNYQFFGAVFGKDIADAKLRFVKENNSDNNFDISIFLSKSHKKSQSYFTV